MTGETPCLSCQQVCQYVKELRPNGRQLSMYISLFQRIAKRCRSSALLGGADRTGVLVEGGKHP